MGVGGLGVALAKGRAGVDTRFERRVPETVVEAGVLRRVSLREGLVGETHHAARNREGAVERVVDVLAPAWGVGSINTSPNAEVICP